MSWCLGSPFEFDVVDPKSVKVNWDSLHLKRVGDIVKVEVATDGSAIDNVISCIITGKWLVCKFDFYWSRTSPLQSNSHAQRFV